MIIETTYKGKRFECNLSKPLDISIPVGQVKCFYSTDFKATPYQSGDFLGSVKEGAPVNFFDVQMNPHGNGTHTECLGHITEKQESLNDQLRQFHFIARLVSVSISKLGNGDLVISKHRLEEVCPKSLPEAVVLRTIPNHSNKTTTDYSGQNPPYLDKEAMKFLIDNGVRHLLLDLPSVDREDDDGLLLSHHLFWNVLNKKAKDQSRANCTITELIYVADHIKDGLYLLNIQIPSLTLDAAPSKPVLYLLNEADKSH